MNTQFTIRREKPTKADKYAKCYITESSGGWSACIIGSPTDECNVLANCVGYATGRFCEVYDEMSGEEGCRYRYLNGNPSSYIQRAKEWYHLNVDNNVRLGDIIVWQGHVAFVEDIIDEDCILMSDSAYNGDAFRLREMHKSNNYGYENLLGFIHNPLIKDEVPEVKEEEPVIEDVPSYDDKKEDIINLIIAIIKKIIYYLFNVKEKE